MEDDTKKAVLALADPIQWQWRRGRDAAGHWAGQSERAAYFIMSPRLPGDVDASLFERSWRLGINLHEGGGLPNAHTATSEQAKELCLYHALTGDMAPISAIRDAAKADSRPFTTAKIAAEASLYRAFQKYNPPPLKWPEDDTGILGLAATGVDGVYTVHFDPDRRWIVTFAAAGRASVERRFLTRTVARNACAVHSHTGQWHGTLSPFVMRDSATGCQGHFWEQEDGPDDCRKDT